ncbi:MAG: spermidine/putrescine-binding protein [Halioglobus sp.]|jgi:spermidine/putrescine-binding protein
MAHRPNTLILSLSTLALCCFISASSLAGQLTVYTWFDYFPERFIQQFEQRSGHTVKLVYFYSDFERDTQIFNAEDSYDLIVTDTHTLPSFERSDLFLEAEATSIPNLKNLDPRWRNTCEDLAVPFFWGGTGIAYRKISGDDDWEVVFPKEGTSIWMDCLSMTKRGKDKALAYEFSNFLLAPQVTAELSEAIWIATPNLAARTSLRKDYLDDTSVFPSDAVLEKIEVETVPSIALQTIRNKILLSLQNNR